MWSRSPHRLVLPNPKARSPWLAGLSVSLLSLIIYVFTLSPTVNFIDSGELVTAGATAGIAHPPGYPLYTLLIIIGGALPFGDRAVGVNLISALAGALAVGLFYALVYEIVRHHLQSPVTAASLNGRTQSNRAARRAMRENGRTDSATRQDKARSTSIPIPATPEPRHEWTAISVSAGAALLLAASFTFWDWATQAKMYTLHFAFVAGLLTLALRARRAIRGAGSPGSSWPPRLWPAPACLLVLLAFGTGLTFTNHFMSVALLPSLAVLIFWSQPRTMEIKGRSVQPDAPPWRWLLSYIPWILVAGLAPLLLYLYLPLRSAQQPLLNWGSPSTWGDFWRHVTLWQSRVLIGKSPQGLLDFLGATIGRASDQLGPWLGILVLFLMIAGIVRLARLALPLLVTMALLVLFTLVETYNLQFAEVGAYSVPMYMMFTTWAAVGLHWLLVFIEDRLTPQQEVESHRPSTLIAAIPLGLALLALVWNAGRTGHANDHLADAYVHNQFKNFAPNAVVITNNWYLASPSYYLQLVRRERPDVAVIDHKLLQYPFYFNYATRQYPDVMATVADKAGPFADITRRWVNGEQVDSNQLSNLFFDMIHALIARNLAAGRPVYLQWNSPGQFENYIAQGLSTHPEGLALRVDSQPFTGPPPDPHFDWRGILTEVVPKDDLAHQVIDDYPLALDRLATYAQQNNHPTEAANFATQAGQVRAALGLPTH